MEKLLRIILIIMAIIVIVATGGIYWATRPAEPLPEALAALQLDATVQVQTEPWLIFRPKGKTPTTGFVIYPGALVNPRAYAPAAKAIAAQGFLVVIPEMPFHLAVLATDRAHQVFVMFPQIHHWVIGGHSMGGVSAITFIDKYPDPVEGLVLWAAFPANTDNLSQHRLTAISIYGTRDKLVTADAINASRPRLPANTRWVAIEGGNHAQFGWYGAQSGDGEATISREQQQAQIVNATVELLKYVDKSP